MSNMEDILEISSTTTATSMDDTNEIGVNLDARAMQASSERLESALSEKNGIPAQESDIGLEWLKLGGSSSTGLIKSESQTEQNLRIQVYQPPKSLQAIVEESKIGLVPPMSHQAKIEEPKVELVSELGQKAIVEMTVAQVGVVIEKSPTTADVTVSDDDGDQSNKDTYESFEDTNDSPNCPSLLPAVDSRCCTRSRVRERETQTPREKIVKRERAARVVIKAHETGKKANVGVIAGTSSDCCSSEQARKLVVKTQNQSTFKQRQLDLHRHRILVEQRRLELLELKIARERDEMIRDVMLYEKELEIKNKQLRKITEDRVDEI